MSKNIIIYSLLAVIVVGVALHFITLKKDAAVIQQVQSQKVMTVKRDTILDVHIVYDTVYFPKTEYKYVYVNDTCYIEDRDSTFRDSTRDYSIDINAVKLNWYSLKIHRTDTVTLTDTVRTITDILIPRKKPVEFYWGVGVGVGYGIINKKPDMFVGVTAGLKFNINR